MGREGKGNGRAHTKAWRRRRASVCTPPDRWNDLDIGNDAVAASCRRVVGAGTADSTHLVRSVISEVYKGGVDTIEYINGKTKQGSNYCIDAIGGELYADGHHDFFGLFPCDSGDPNQDFNHEKFAAGQPGVLELSEFNFPPMALDEVVSMYNTGTKNGAEIHGEWKTSEITERTKWVLSAVPAPTTRRALLAKQGLRHRRVGVVQERARGGKVGRRPVAARHLGLLEAAGVVPPPFPIPSPSPPRPILVPPHTLPFPSALRKAAVSLLLSRGRGPRRAKCTIRSRPRRAAAARRRRRRGPSPRRPRARPRGPPRRRAAGPRPRGR